MLTRTPTLPPGGPAGQRENRQIHYPTETQENPKVQTFHMPLTAGTQLTLSSPWLGRTGVGQTPTAG